MIHHDLHHEWCQVSCMHDLITALIDWKVIIIMTETDHASCLSLRSNKLLLTSIILYPQSKTISSLNDTFLCNTWPLITCFAALSLLVVVVVVVLISTFSCHLGVGRTY